MYGGVYYAGAPYAGLVPVLATPGASSGYTSARSASQGHTVDGGGASTGRTTAGARSTGRTRRSQ